MTLAAAAVTMLQFMRLLTPLKTLAAAVATVILFARNGLVRTCSGPGSESKCSCACVRPKHYTAARLGPLIAVKL